MEIELFLLLLNLNVPIEYGIIYSIEMNCIGEKMKSHKIEKIIFSFSIVSFVIFVLSIFSYFILGDKFWIVDVASRFIYTYGTLSVFVIIFINWRRKKRGYNNPLSIEAMRTAKKELPDKIYKYCSLSIGDVVDLDKKKMYSLENNKIWMSDCSALNDPYEGMYAFVEEQIGEQKNKILRYLIDRINNERDMYIQSSFSYDSNNVLMWGHYANGCRGYCIEYAVTSKQNLFPVQYLAKRPLLSSVTHNQTVKNNIKKIERSVNEIEDPEEFITYVLYIQAMKGLCWSYEKEVRLVEVGSAGEHGKCGNVDSEDYGLKTSKIIIGCYCKYRKELIDIAKKLEVPVSIMEIQLNSNKYQLVEKEITYDDEPISK